MAKIKICGLTRKEDIMAVNEFPPDYIGFVFAPSKRRLTLSEAQELKLLLSPKILSVGVYVNAPQTDIVSAAASGVIDIIQLHGEEDARYMEEIKSMMGLPIIKALRIPGDDTVKSRDILQTAQQLPCDYLLLDSYVGGIQGGSGQSFPWSVIPDLSKPFFLAGGITPDTLKEAAATKAYCLDLSSGAETNGQKDPEKIQNIIEQIRRINQCQKEDSDNTEDNISPKH